MIEYSFKKLGIFTPFMQLSSITVTFIATVLLTYQEYIKDHKVFTSYDPGFGTVFAPIYEEIIFRGIIQNELTRLYGTTRSIIGTSLLFGIYHLKNIYRLSPGIQVQQILRTGCVLGPILSILAHKTKSIRTGSILHYLNNIIATIHVPL